MSHSYMHPTHSLVKRYVPSDPSHPAECVSSSIAAQVMGIATLLTCVGFTIQFYTGVICLFALMKTRRKSRSNSANFLLCHMLALELANIIGLVTALIGFMWCLGPLRPFSQPPREGDSDGWQLFDEALQKFLGRWKQLGYSSNASFVVSGFLTDGVLIWRCRQIAKITLYSRPNLLMVIPTMSFLASIGLGILSCFNLAKLGGVAYFAVSLTLNMYLTAAIVYQLLRCKFQTQSILGRRHGRHYDVLSILFVESASMNVFCSAFLLVSNIVVNSNVPIHQKMVWKGVFEVFVAITPAVQTCSNYLIIYRGTQGFCSSWNDAATRNPISIALQSPAIELSNRADANNEKSIT